jgi:hypothetical protein
LGYDEVPQVILPWIIIYNYYVVRSSHGV